MGKALEYPPYHNICILHIDSLCTQMFSVNLDNSDMQVYPHGAWGLSPKAFLKD